MRSLSLPVTVAILIGGLPGSAQNVVEYSTGAARAGTAAGASGAGKAAGGVFGGLSKTIENSGSANRTAPRPAGEPEAGQVSGPDVGPAPIAAAVASSRPVKPEDVPIGMERAALVEKFGRPLMKTARMDGNAYSEVFFYPHPADDMTVVTLRDGKVSAVRPPAGPSESPKSPGR